MHVQKTIFHEAKRFINDWKTYQELRRWVCSAPEVEMMMSPDCIIVINEWYNVARTFLSNFTSCVCKIVPGRTTGYVLKLAHNDVNAKFWRKSIAQLKIFPDHNCCLEDNDWNPRVGKMWKQKAITFTYAYITTNKSYRKYSFFNFGGEGCWCSEANICKTTQWFLLKFAVIQEHI